MTDFEVAVERLTAWLRDYGPTKNKPFVDDVTIVLYVAKQAALHGIDVKKCEQCGGLRLKMTTPLCSCNVEFATGTIS
jgi:hypothetical protein